MRFDNYYSNYQSHNFRFPNAYIELYAYIYPYNNNRKHNTSNCNHQYLTYPNNYQ